MVTIYPCDSYETVTVQKAVDLLIKDLGGFEPYLSPGEKVLLKVNMIGQMAPELAATTHPVFVECLARRIVEYGCKAIIGDSPGGTFNTAVLKRGYQITGYEEAAQKSGAELSFNTDQKTISFPEGKRLKTLTVTDMSQDADKIISVSKLKTHSMMTFTGAVKNLFGTIPGTVKAEYHFRMPKMEDFAEALLDIYEAQHPVLSFMDAVIGMEGNGPSHGKPRKIGALLASANAHELDKVACELIGLKESDVPTLSHAKVRGLLPERFELKGTDPAVLSVNDYQLPDNIHTDVSTGWVVPGFMMKWLRPKVRFDKDICIGCGKCAASCPAKALVMKKRPKNEHKLPICDHEACIRCYCCQELCPKGAVSIHESFVFKLVNRL